MIQIKRTMAVSSTQFLVMMMMVVVVATVSSTPLIQAPWGTIQGMEMTGDDGRKMDGYLGIPFALPPVGDLRFEKPVPHPGPGEGKVFAADAPIPACYQAKGVLIDASAEVSEDCLKLNVFVPTGGANSDSLYPVMFFIHGGGFTMGDATFYRPSKLVADGQVIVVVIQYRLGPFGFMSSGDHVLPGNQGLWDQNLALRWVKDNIRAFGGDPDLITVFGESAGSVSTGLQMISPYSSKMMKRAILQSGSPSLISKLGFMLNNKIFFRQQADLFECQEESTAELVQCLKKVDAEEFFNKTSAFGDKSPLRGISYPVIDGDFFPRDVLELIEDEEYLKEIGAGDIDVMSGFNNKEGSMMLLMLIVTQQSEEMFYSPQIFQSFLESCIAAFAVKAEARDVVKKAVEFYYRGADSFTNNSLNGKDVVDMYGDCLLMAPAVDWTRRLAAMSHTSSHYLYVMDHDFTYNNAGPVPGSHHGDDLALLFDLQAGGFNTSSMFSLLNKTVLAGDDLPLSEKFVQIFTTFAKTGNPSPPVRGDLGGDWPQFTTENEAYLSLSKSPRVQNGLGSYSERTALWMKLVPELEALMSGMSPAGKEEESKTGKDEL